MFRTGMNTDPNRRHSVCLFVCFAEKVSGKRLEARIGTGIRQDVAR